MEKENLKDLMAAEYVAASLCSLYPGRFHVLSCGLERMGFYVKGELNGDISNSMLPHIKERYQMLVSEVEPKRVEMVPESAKGWLKSLGIKQELPTDKRLLQFVQIGDYINLCSEIGEANPFIHLYPIERDQTHVIIKGISAEDKQSLKKRVDHYRLARENDHLQQLSGYFEPPHFLQEGIAIYQGVMEWIETTLYADYRYVITADLNSYPSHGVWTFKEEPGKNTRGLYDSLRMVRTHLKIGQRNTNNCNSFLQSVQKISKILSLKSVVVDNRDEGLEVYYPDCYGKLWKMAEWRGDNATLCYSVERLIALLAEHKIERLLKRSF